MNPAHLPIFSKINGKTSLEILYRYTTAEAILAADKNGLIALIAQTSLRGNALAEKKYAQLIQAAKEAASFGHINSGNSLLIHHFVEMIRFNEAQAENLLAQIRRIIDEQPNSCFARQVRLIETIPGAGFLTAVTIVCEIGDFGAFRRSKQLYAYFGLDPKVRQSGNFIGTQLSMSKRGSPFARRSLYMLALQSVSLRKNGEPKNSVLREYYQKKCESKAKMTALGAVMHKICNIIFAVLRDEKPFVLITPEQHHEAYQTTMKSVA